MLQFGLLGARRIGQVHARAISGNVGSRRAVRGSDQRVELLGSDGLQSAKNVLENTVEKNTVAGVTGAKPTCFFLERSIAAYAAEWAASADVVENSKTFTVTLADGVVALVLAEAATRSGRSEPVAAEMLGVAA